MTEPRHLQLLTYTYVDGISELRAQHRAAHLAHIAAWHADGRLVIAGAAGDPPTTGLLAFDTSAEDVEAFGAADPYTVAGLVKSRTIQPWTVVAGGDPRSERS